MSAIERHDQRRVRRDAHPPAVRQGRRRARRRPQPRRVRASARGRRRRDRRTTARSGAASSWLEIHADNTILLRTGKVELGQGSAQHRLRADHGRGAERPVRRDHAGRDGRHDRTPDGGFSAGYMGTAATRTSARWPRTPTRRCSASPRRSSACPVVEPDGEGRVVSGGGKRLTYGELVPGPAAEPDDPGHGQPAEPLRPHGHAATRRRSRSAEYTDRRPVDPDAARSRRSSRARRPTSATSGCRACSTPASCIRRRSARRSSSVGTARQEARSRTRRSS